VKDSPDTRSHRRRLLRLLLATPLLAVPVWSPLFARAGTSAVNASTEEGADMSLDEIPPVTYSKEDWRELLEPEAYDILFRDKTERAFTSPLNDEKRVGTYICAACYLPLFASDQKFDSGTGWPSFFDHIPGHIGTRRDFKMIIPRTEYHCIRCEGHQGHVFSDGPEPTGQRWCNNGRALRFIPDGEALPELRG
jgi:peptide-methionine (R)-S-oxide reductase